MVAVSLFRLQQPMKQGCSSGFFWNAILGSTRTKDTNPVYLAYPNILSTHQPPYFLGPPKAQSIELVSFRVASFCLSNVVQLLSIHWSYPVCGMISVLLGPKVVPGQNLQVLSKVDIFYCRICMFLNAIRGNQMKTLLFLKKKAPISRLSHLFPRHGFMQCI